MCRHIDNMAELLYSGSKQNKLININGLSQLYGFGISFAFSLDRKQKIKIKGGTKNDTRKMETRKKLDLVSL